MIPGPFSISPSDTPGLSALNLSRAARGVTRAFALAQDAAAASLTSPDAAPLQPRADMTEDQARNAAADLVSISLVQPVLAQLRKTNNAWGPFQPGLHEKQFGPLLDAEVATRITRSMNFPIVDAVARNLLKASQRLARDPHAGEPRASESGPGAPDAAPASTPARPAFRGTEHTR